MRDNACTDARYIHNIKGDLRVFQKPLTTHCFILKYDDADVSSEV